MAASFASAVSVATILALAVSGLASAGDLRLTFLNGRVTLVAHDVPLRKILAEWERVGGTRVVNRDAAPAASVTLDLSDVTEARALATLLQQAAGYFASERSDPVGTTSRFTRIVIMPGAVSPPVAPQAAAGPQPSGTTDGPAPGRPRVQQRIMPGGRVISVMEYPARQAEPPIVEEAEPVQPPPIEAPVGMAVPMVPGMASAPAAPNPSPDSLPTQASPTVPATAAKPGARIPGPKAEPAPYTPQGPPPPPVPIIKSPGV